MSEGTETGAKAASPGELLTLIRRYAIQETLTPLRRLGRSLALGLGAAILCSIGVALLLVAVLRALETETGSVFSGSYTWVPFFLTAILGLAVVGSVLFFGVRAGRTRRAGE